MSDARRRPDEPFRSAVTGWMTGASRQQYYPPMSEETECKLREVYRTDLERLETLLERDLSRWRHPEREPINF